MSLGLGIFLSSIVFALLILYWITRYRWRWRLLARRIGKALGAVVVLAVLVGGAFYGYAEYKDMPRRQDTYAGIKLGATMEEILYLKGYPDAVVEPFEGVRLQRALAQIPEGKRVEDYLEWVYNMTGVKDALSVEFSDTTHKVRMVACYSSSEDVEGRNACPTLLGIAARDDEATVLRKLGPATRETLEGLRKKIEYAQFNVRFFLAKGRVFWLQVIDYDAASKAK